MKTKAIRIAIAEAVGWSKIHTSGRLDGQLVGYPTPPLVLGKFLEIPHYESDLNAMHEAEKTLEPHWLPSGNQHTDDSMWEMYVCALSKIADKGPSHATAQQRAEAFLKTIGKWRDE